MYEVFHHPTRIQAEAWLETKLAERRADIEQYLTENNREITDAIIERHYQGYRRTLIRRIRARISNVGLYVYAELPISFLDLQVPNSLPWNKKVEITGLDTEGFPIFEVVRRTFREYLVWYKESLDGTKVLFRLAGMPVNKRRPRGVREAELDIWKTLLEGRGFNWNNVGTLTHWRQRLNSAAYLDEQL